jgi:predicted house-cleaning noncanonical NTP pyrophosphatase (MazG superfamily)
MARIQYDKLIRDRIPEIITAEGKQYATEVMTGEDYRLALLRKLVEEAQEAASASPEKLVTELADLFEVLEAVIAAHGLDPHQLREVQRQRRADRGGFEQHLKLLWVEEMDA